MPHPLLFSPNPPNDEELIHMLFCLREKETKYSLDCLAECYDYGKICAIYGQTKVGKSHFAKYLISKLQNLFPNKYFSVEINANNARSCISVFSGIYEKLVKLFRKESDVIQSTEDETKKALIKMCSERIESFAVWKRFGNLDFLEKHLTTEESKQYANVGKQYASGSLASKIWQFISAEVKLGLETTQSVSTSKKITSTEKQKFNPPDENTYIDLIVFVSGIISLLLCKNENEVPRFLLYADDLDLLEQPTESERKEIDDMIDYLCRLAQEPFITVLASVRDYFYYFREKDFEYFQELEPMEPEELKCIYSRQIEVLNEGESLFDEDALDMLIRSSDRTPGRFMRYLKKVHVELYGEPKYTLEKTSRVFFKRFLKVHEKTRTKILDAIKEGAMQIPEDKIDSNELRYLTPMIEYSELLTPLSPRGGFEIPEILYHSIKLFNKDSKS
jgi:Cdc6-like AAA superfamily ATPase